MATSRSRLLGLVAGQGAAVLALDALPRAAGYAVLAGIVGPPRLEA